MIVTVDTAFVVMWYCLHDRPIAVFTERPAAEAAAAQFKIGIDALLGRMGLTPDERVEVVELPLNRLLSMKVV